MKLSVTGTLRHQDQYSMNMRNENISHTAANSANIPEDNTRSIYATLLGLLGLHCGVFSTQN